MQLTVKNSEYSPESHENWPRGRELKEDLVGVGDPQSIVAFFKAVGYKIIWVILLSLHSPKLTRFDGAMSGTVRREEEK